MRVQGKLTHYPIGRRSHEGICYDYRRGLWAAHIGASFADRRGRAATRYEPAIRSHHRCRSKSVSLGLAPALALETVVSQLVKPKIEENSHEASTLYSGRPAGRLITLPPDNFRAAAGPDEFHTSSHSGAATWSASDPNAGSKRSNRAYQRRRNESVASYADFELSERCDWTTADC